MFLRNHFNERRLLATGTVFPVLVFESPISCRGLQLTVAHLAEFEARDKRVEALMERRSADYAPPLVPNLVHFKVLSTKPSAAYVCVDKAVTKLVQVQLRLINSGVQ